MHYDADSIAPTTLQHATPVAYLSCNRESAYSIRYTMGPPFCIGRILSPPPSLFPSFAPLLPLRGHSCPSSLFPLLSIFPSFPILHSLPLSLSPSLHFSISPFLNSLPLFHPSYSFVLTSLPPPLFQALGRLEIFAVILARGFSLRERCCDSGS